MSWGLATIRAAREAVISADTTIIFVFDAVFEVHIVPCRRPTSHLWRGPDSQPLPMASEQFRIKIAYRRREERRGAVNLQAWPYFMVTAFFWRSGDTGHAVKPRSYHALWRRLSMIGLSARKAASKNSERCVFAIGVFNLHVGNALTIRSLVKRQRHRALE